jgi:hypothetical protein
LQTRQRDELIIDKLENAVKAGNHKDAARGILYAAQDKAVVAVFENFAEFEYFCDTRRCNDIHIREIHHYIATAPVPYNFDNRPQFFTHLRFLGECYQYYIFRPILNAHSIFSLKTMPVDNAIGKVRGVVNSNFSELEILVTF